MNVSLKLARQEKTYPHQPDHHLDCPTCHQRLVFSTVPLTGVLWQACRCGEQPVPVKRLGETVIHDQAQRLGAQLQRALKSAMQREMKPAPRPVGGHPWTNRGTV